MASIPFYQDPAFLRKQTLCLLGATILGEAAMFLPVHSQYSVVEMAGLMGNKPAADPTMAVVTFVLLLAASWFSFVMMFFYKNLNRQLLLIRVNMVEYVSATIAAYVMTGGSMGYAITFPLIAIVLLFVATRFIQSDMKLLKSMDRFW